MEKVFQSVWMSAIAFTGAVSFTACSSSDEVTDNPNYNPETNAVKTEFVINVTQPNERTRMAADDAGASTFQGINNMQLFCYNGAPATVNAMEADHKLVLTSYNTPTPSGTNTTSSSKVYTLYIPAGTTNFLFYATALENVSNKFAQGSLTNNLTTASTVSSTPAANTDIQFALESIVPTTSATTVTIPQGKLLTILNGIKNAQVDDTHKWSDTHALLDTHLRALGRAFDEFTNQASGGDVRQGSSIAIKNMVSELFTAIYDIYRNESNADAKALAEAVLEAISSYFSVTKTGEDAPYVYTWENAYKPETDGAVFNTYSYPESQNLPTGSAVIIYSNEGGFAFVNDGTMGTATISTAYDKFTYPSQLTYYSNSGLWQTATSKNTTDYPTTSANWADASNWTGWANTAVTAATRAVAMKDNITYGAAQLFSTVKLGANIGGSTALVDNANVVTSGVESDQEFNTGNPIVLKVHGILIGGQPAASQYEYLPKDNDATKVIYDKFSANGETVNETGITNYTLALDNYTSEATQSTVNVALEMTADKDFYGASGKIKAGQKFYLIGSLNPSVGGTITWADHKSFKTGDTGKEKDRVFIRDAKTVATFTLGANSLQKAYSTIPDLRSTQMLFGISVDLAWKAGLTFNVNLGE